MVINFFKPYVKYDEASDKFISLQHQTVEKGDGTYSSIAAASILAKVERDKYIEELCSLNPELIEFETQYNSLYLKEMGKKIGLTQPQSDDLNLINELLSLMEMIQ